MAEKKEITLRATLREGRGKNDARRARRDGKVPVTIYGGEGETVAALASLGELAAILRSDSGRNTIFTLDVEGVGASEVMFADRQIDRRRDPDIRAIHQRRCAAKILGADSDHGARVTIDAQRLAHDRRIRAEPLPPDSITDHNFGCPARAFETPERRMHAQSLEVGRRDHMTPNALRLPANRSIVVQMVEVAHLNDVFDRARRSAVPIAGPTT